MPKRSARVLALAAIGLTACDAASSRLADRQEGGKTDDPSSDIEPVTVRVLGIGRADMAVLFYDRDAAYLGATETDADGVAIGELPSGATVVLPEIDDERVEAIFGVEPGDEVTVLTRREEPARRSMTLEVPALAGTVDFSASTPCGGGSGGSASVSLSFESQCEGQTADVLVQTRSSADRISAARRGALTLAGGAHATLAGEWFAAEPFAFEVVGSPVALTQVSGLITPVIGGVAPSRLSMYTTPVSLASGASVAIEKDVAPSNVVDGRWASLLTRDGAASVQTDKRMLAPDEDVATFDLADDPLPRYQRGTWERNSRRIDIPRSAGAALDGQRAYVQWAEPEEEAHLGWHLVLPPDVTSVVLPKLPPEHHWSDPSGGIWSVIDVSCTGFESTELEGYRDYLADRRFLTDERVPTAPGSRTRSSFISPLVLE